jgi:hypothetical protein
MQQTCSRCGAAATVPSKFCRQCGAPLATEEETREAATRQYGRQSPAPEPPPASHPFTTPGQRPPSVSDAFAADTSRLHNQAPPPPLGQPFSQQPGVPAPFAPAYPVQPASKSNWWKWALGFVLATVLVCGGLLAYTVQRATVAGSRVKEEIDKAVAIAKEEAEKAAQQGSSAPNGQPYGVPPPPPAPPAPGELSQDLEQLRYPNAKVASRVNALGQQVLTLKTNDTLDKVKTYYTEKLGAPIVESEEENERNLVFQKAPLMVTVGQDRRNPSQLDITIIRSGLIPQLNQ